SRAGSHFRRRPRFLSRIPTNPGQISEDQTVRRGKSRPDLDGAKHHSWNEPHRGRGFHVGTCRHTANEFISWSAAIPKDNAPGKHYRERFAHPRTTFHGEHISETSGFGVLSVEIPSEISPNHLGMNRQSAARTCTKLRRCKSQSIRSM